jgi:hypothetical protein
LAGASANPENAAIALVARKVRRSIIADAPMEVSPQRYGPILFLSIELVYK